MSRGEVLVRTICRRCGDNRVFAPNNKTRELVGHTYREYVCAFCGRVVLVQWEGGWKLQVKEVCHGSAAS